MKRTAGCKFGRSFHVVDKVKKPYFPQLISRPCGQESFLVTKKPSTQHSFAHSLPGDGRLLPAIQGNG